MPGKKRFHTVRVVSDILESNGSSSMALVCGGSLAMMDAGVPLKAPVAGIAMGWSWTRRPENYAVLSDIAGPRITWRHGLQGGGNRHGITALQMDIKVFVITTEVMRKALEQARQGRMHILESCSSAFPLLTEHLELCPAHRHDSIPVDKIRDVIGPGAQDDSKHHRADRRQDRRGRRWPRERGVSGIAPAAQKAISIIQEPHGNAELNKTYL